MSSIFLEIIIVLALIVFNGVLSMAETALVSARRTRLQSLADRGDPKAHAALRITADPSRFLSTIQAGITLIGIITGAVGGTTLARELAPIIARVGVLAPFSDAIGVALVVIPLTYVSIVVGELVPKQVALHNPDGISLAMAPFMRVLSLILTPAVRLLSGSSGLVLRILGIPAARQQPVSEEEIKVMIDQGIEHGMFEKAERDMIEGVFDLGDTRVNELMTPRTDVVWLDVNDTQDEVQRKIRECGHSRFPVCRGGLDTVLGVVRAKDILNCVLCAETLDLAKWMRPPLYVPENALSLKALETFKKSRSHVALAVDEYGVVQGLITFYDILEAVVGDIPSFDEIDEPMAVKRKDGTWLLDGLLPMEKFKEIFGVGETPEEGSYQTIGGFIMMHLGRIPAPADSFVWGGVRLEIVDMEGTRVGKVLATPQPLATDPASTG